MDAWDRNQFCNDLTAFSDIFVKVDVENVVASSLAQLSRTSRKIRSKKLNLFESPEIVFEIKKKVGGTIPADIETITINFSMLCEHDETIDNTIFDPIKDYSFQIQITGKSKKDNETRNFWHLDKDIPPNKDDVQRFTHPVYHFQSGGHGMDSLESTGDVLILSAPRLPHPPMDIFLGVHFILNNFVSRKDYPFVEKLFSNHDYNTILKRAQKRMFDPYFSAFSQFTLDNNHNDFTLDKVFPTVV